MLHCQSLEWNFLCHTQCFLHSIFQRKIFPLSGSQQSSALHWSTASLILPARRKTRELCPVTGRLIQCASVRRFFQYSDLMNLAVEKLVHFRSRSQIRWHLTIYMSEQHLIRGERQGRGSTLQDPRAVRLELPPASPVFCLNQRRRVLSTSLLHTIKRESKRPLVHRGATASHVTASSILPPFLLLRTRRPFHRQISVPIYWDVVSTASFLLGSRNGYLNLSIFRRLGVLAL